MKKRFVSVLAFALLMGLAVPARTYAAEPVNVDITYGKVSKADSNVIYQMFDEVYYAATYPDVVNALGSSRKALLNHFLNFGIYEGRNCTADFNVSAYASGYADLKAAFVDNIPAYYVHYVNHGKTEGRSITTIEKALDAGITVVSVTDGTVIAKPQPVAPSPAPASDPDPAPAPSQESETETKQEEKSDAEVTAEYEAAFNIPKDQWNPAPDYTEQDIIYNLKLIVELVNIERAKVGAAPLTEVRLLDESAEIRAGEIPYYFAHERLDGSGFETSINRRWLGATLVGENIAAGFHTAEEVMEGWMNSPGHRENILRPEYTRIGVAYSTAETPYGTYWVQHFSN